MSDEWREVNIENIASRIAMGPFGSDIKTDNFIPSGVPVIRGGNLTSGRFNPANFVFVSEAKANELSNANAFPGDLVFTHRGTLGQVGLIPAEPFERYIVSQSQMKLTCDTTQAEPLFIYYFFRSEEGQHQLLMNTSQTGVPAISRPTTSLKSIRLRIPPLSNQRAIAHILGALDDKIELNRRRNETLEAIARALFKSWFIDFDPVRTKSEGRATRLPLHIADLFPDAFVDSAFGEIPRGWEIGKLEDIAENPRRGVDPNEIDPASPYIALEHMPRYCISLSEWGVAQGLKSGKFKFKEGDILFGKLRPYFHKVGVAPVNGVCSTDIVVVTPRKNYWFGEVLGYISSNAFVEFTNASSTGTKMPRTNWSEMSRYAIVHPPISISRTFTQQIRPLIDRMNIAIHENYTLASLRDALLPRLISGKLCITDAERIIENTP